MNQRAITYRRLHDIPESWGTAVNVQAMVFGNLGETSATGVAFTRNPSTGEKQLYGEFLINAQGEDVVAGIRTPQEITEAARKAADSDKPSMEKAMPKAFAELTRIYDMLEKHYRDMQDLEFTVEKGKLWMLQTRSGKRTAKAALRIAVELANEKLITKRRGGDAHRSGRARPVAASDHRPESRAQGDRDRPAGLARRRVGRDRVFVRRSRAAEEPGQESHPGARRDQPEDIHGMHAAEGILTTRGGMTSHAAVVARGMGKPCVSGAGALRVDYAAKTCRPAASTLKKGDIITIDGSTGQVLAGSVAMLEPELVRRVRDADALGRRGAQARRARQRRHAGRRARAVKFGAEGIGLCRTEHMFFDEERIRAVREMILADDEKAAARRSPSSCRCSAPISSSCSRS